MADWARQYGIDMKRLVADAEEAGFNPLTFIRNGMWQAYLIDMLGAQTVADEADYLVEYGGGEITSDGGGGGGGSDGFSYMYEQGGYNGIWTDQGRFVRTRPASEARGYHDSMVDVVAYSGGTPIAAPAVNGGAGPATPRVRTASSPAPKATPAKADKELPDQFQQEQIWDKDKQPRVIVDSTFHYILPGVTFEETGGTTRVEMFETGYGEDAPGTQMLGFPKFANDLGWNVQRLFNHVGVPTLKGLSGRNALEWAYAGGNAISRYMSTPQGPLARPVAPGSMAAPPNLREVSGGVYDVWGNSGGSEPSPYRATPSYSAAKSAAKSTAATPSAASSSASKTASKAEPSSKDQSKAEKTKSEEKSSSAGSSKKK
ncbi:hypothetical protein SAMN05428969_3271 [Devosia sp. YR412]|uniref:hypothetical protein n=1 Tax=Devosia sp. YR412 TaxID=1881030 RepID=UPI0008D21439|nr:hypothetical protein [Devosia sp. YR412]SEQ49333.1 hypothetical protein SAMN05428969_3271 [Devosia sp. YR412]